MKPKRSIVRLKLITDGRTRRATVPVVVRPGHYKGTTEVWASDPVSFHWRARKPLKIIALKVDASARGLGYGENIDIPIPLETIAAGDTFTLQWTKPILVIKMEHGRGR